MVHWAWWARGHTPWADADRRGHTDPVPLGLADQAALTTSAGYEWMCFLHTVCAFQRKSSNSRGEKRPIYLERRKRRVKCKGQKAILRSITVWNRMLFIRSVSLFQWWKMVVYSIPHIYVLRSLFQLSITSFALEVRTALSVGEENTFP